MRGVRVAVMLGALALACAKERAETTTAAPVSAESVSTKSDAAAGAGAAPTKEDLEEAHRDEALAPPPEPPSFEELVASLDRYEAELRSEGVRLKSYRKDKVEDVAQQHPPRNPKTPKPAVPTKPATVSPGGGEAPVSDRDDPCPRICAIASSVCEIRDRVCAMAQEHTDVPRYATACKRAEKDCKRATEACDGCG